MHCAATPPRDDLLQTCRGVFILVINVIEPVVEIIACVIVYSMFIPYLLGCCCCLGDMMLSAWYWCITRMACLYNYLGLGYQFRVYNGEVDLLIDLNDNMHTLIYYSLFLSC